MLMYLRMCLAYNAGLEPDLESTATMQAQSPAIAKFVEVLIQEQPGDKGPINLYITTLKQLLTVIGGEYLFNH